MYSDSPVAYLGLEWFCCGKDITWKESALEPTKGNSRGKSSQPSEHWEAVYSHPNGTLQR